jgi:hypothetical protein
MEWKRSPAIFLNSATTGKMRSMSACGLCQENMTDSEFVRALEACELSNESFHHREHIRLAWIYVQRFGELEARAHMREAIRKFAAFHGKSDKYHETITVAWVRLVAEAMTQRAHHASFEDLTLTEPHLLDKRTIERFYSVGLLASEAARTSWVEPDLKPLP